METLRYILVVLIIQGIVGVSPGQQFGRNKFSYQNPDFQVKTSPNFEYYYHFDNDSLINHLINRSEWWYAFHQQVFNDTIPFKNPLIFYDNHNDFTVTETISGTIGQGTGGVTESFKNRVIMPLHISPRQTNHVLGHELVHAFQYNMFRGDSALTMNHMRNLPLWMVEGLAEYMSLGAEDITTSMWMRDAVLHDDLPNFRQLSTNPDYFPYRYGHSFWAFITGVYGDSIIAKFFRETALMGFERSCKNVLGIDHKSLALAWHENLKQHYKPLLEGRQAQPVGHPLFNQKKTDINLAPAISPDGHYVAVLSDRNIFTVDLLLIDAHSGEVIKTLFTTRRSNRADEINFIENSGSWSPESMRFAFVVNEKGKNALAIISITGKDIQTINIAEVDEIYYPAWSPDGSLIVFTGMKEGVSNLYLLDPDTRQIKKITHTRYYTKLHPTWSPAGNKVAFSADFDHKHYELAEIDLRDGTIRPLPLFDETDHFNPSYDQQGNLYFIATPEGIPNIYKYDPSTGNLYRVTNFFTGVSGITAFGPAFSLSHTGQLAYAYFTKGEYHIYQGSLTAFENTLLRPTRITSRAALILPPDSLHGEEASLTSKLKENTSYVLTSDSIINHRYKRKFQLDYIGNTAGVGIGATTAGGGRGAAEGGVNMLFSDMLGENQLYAGMAAQGDILDMGGGFAYLNKAKRVPWGVGASHVPYRMTAYEYMLDSIPVYGWVERLDFYNFRTFVEQIDFYGQYPFSINARLESSISLSRYHFHAEQWKNYYAGTLLVAQEKQRLPSPEGFNIGVANIAWVFDNSFFGVASPMDGMRIRAGADQYLGVINMQTYNLDFRKYVFLRPISLAFRATTTLREGRDADNGLLYPLSLAYPWNTHGNNLDSFYDSPEAYEVLNNLFGTGIAVVNAEVRWPLSGPENLSGVKSRYFYTELGWFIDAGLTWYEGSNYSETGGDDWIQRAVVTTGPSLRINFFGQLVIEPYWAFHLTDARKGEFGLNFLPGW